MAQTPYRDIIKTAIVDFRFFTGSTKNFANNTNALVFTATSDPVIHKVNGVNALVNSASSASQTWMTDVSANKEATFEMLVSLDNVHIGDDTSSVSTFTIVDGSWNLGFAVTRTANYSYKTYLWMEFNSGSWGGAAYIYQELNTTTSPLSKFKGSPLHVIVSAKYITATSLEITTYVNGVYNNVTDSTIGYAMDTTPTNTLFNDFPTDANCPIYLFRMWDTYMEDQMVFWDMYQQSKKILPRQEFPNIDDGTITFYEAI